MPIDQPETNNARHSRRGFLARLGLGVAAVAAATFPLGHRDSTGGAGAQGVSREFPDEDSIFHPAQDPRLDPRREKST